jgi:hypothetical protein
MRMIAADKDGYAIVVQNGHPVVIKAVDAADYIQDAWMAARIADQDFQRGWTHDA